MSVGEILDASFALLRRHVVVFFGVTVVCLGIPTALTQYTRFAGAAFQNLWLILLAQILNWAGYLIVTGASIRIVSQAYLGQETSMGDALQFAVRKIGRTLSSGFAAGILATIALFLLIVPGIIVFCGLAVAVQAAVLEPLKAGSDGLGRSWSLTRGYKWKALGLYVVVGFLFFLLVAGLGIIAALATALSPSLLLPAVLVFALIFLLAYPFTSCVFTLFYYDLRVRKEAFDLELLGQHIGVAVSAV